MRARRDAIALVAATIAGVVAVVATTSFRDDPVGSGVPSASAAPTAASARTPRVVFAHSVVLDYVPGGGAVTTSAYDAFEIVTPNGRPSSRNVAGVAVSTPVFDGHGRIAYWRRASITRSPLGFSGPFEVVVWDIRADQERVLLTLASNEGSGGDPRWSADGRSLVVPTRTIGTGGGESRLLLVDAASGATRVLHAGAGSAAIGPLYVDADVLIGVRGSSYVVLDVNTGALRTETPMRVPTAFLQESTQPISSADGIIAELHRRFESEAGPLWIWSVRDPSADLAKVDERGLSDPVFWPGRSEVVFTRSAGLAAVDYRSGQTRPLVTSPGVSFVVAVDASGRFALIRRDAGLEIVERVNDELRARPDLQLALYPLLKPIAIVLP